jgi:hypothetical protein
MVSFENWGATTFDSNIQQVKLGEFEVLYCGLFFSDRVVIFHIGSDQIGSQIGCCPTQHKGNVGEGQFHVTQRNLQFHLDNYHYQTLSYEELLDLLSD